MEDQFIWGHYVKQNSVWFLKPVILSDLLFVVLVWSNPPAHSLIKMHFAFFFLPPCSESNRCCVSCSLQETRYATWLNWVLLRKLSSVLLQRLQLLAVDHIFLHLAHSSPESNMLNAPETFWSSFPSNFLEFLSLWVLLMEYLSWEACGYCKTFHRYSAHVGYCVGSVIFYCGNRFCIFRVAGGKCQRTLY